MDSLCIHKKSSSKLQPQSRRKLVPLVAAALATLMPAASVSAQAARPEAVSHAILSIERGCPITPPLGGQGDDGPARVAPILGSILAGIAGNMVTSGLNSAGLALESVAQEKGFVAEGMGSFTAYRVDNDGKPTDRWRAIPDLEVDVLPDGAPGEVSDATTTEAANRCVVLAIPADTAKTRGPRVPELTSINIQSAFTATGIQQARAANAEIRLKALGLNQLPALYVEAELVEASDGMAIRPVLVRYAEPLPGAPKSAAATELHVSLAVPGMTDTSDLGAVFARARIKLPKMAPSKVNDVIADVLNRDELRAYTSVVVPYRATAGSVDAALVLRNGVVTALDTKKAETAQLKEALRISQRSLDQNKDTAKVQDLTNARDDANLAYSDAVADQAKLSQAARFDSLTSGSTNITARFVVIRDARQFALALARALKSQADKAGTAVAAKLEPKPAWTTQDTAYIDAENAVKAAQRAVDDAVAAGEISKLPGLRDAVVSAKARANEAAVASGRNPPYAIL